MVNIIPRLTHVTFPVKNMNESLDFYKQWFNLEIHLDRRPKGNTVWITTAEQNKKETPDFVFVVHEGDINEIDHFGFQVENQEDVYTMAEKAKQAGIVEDGPEFIGGAVGTYVLIRDPNGHIWEYTHGQPLLGI